MPIIFDDATGKWIDDQTGDFVDDPNLPVPNAPAPSGEWAGWDAAVTALYQKYLKRTPSQAEVISHRGNPRGLNGVEAAILGSDEYKSLPPAPTDPEGPKDGNYQAWFMSLVSGKAPTPAELIKLEPTLTKHGIKVLRNAAGIAGKIQLPDGKTVDVIVGASRGGEAWSWQTGGGGESPAASSFDPKTFGEFNEKWTQEFTPAKYTPSEAFKPSTPAQSPFAFKPSTPAQSPFAFSTPAPSEFSYTAPTVAPLSMPEYTGTGAAMPGPFTYEDFVAPTEADMLQDPGYKVRMAEGLKAIDTSAAARGTLLTGGTLKGLTKYGQEQASNEYQNVFGRKASTWTANQGNAKSEWDSANQAWLQGENAYNQKYTANANKSLAEFNAQKSLSDTGFSQAASAWGMNADRANALASRELQGYAANTAANDSAWNRENTAWQQNDAANYRNWNAQNQTALTDYQQKYKIWYEQQQAAFDRLYKLSALGQNTAVAS